MVPAGEISWELHERAFAEYARTYGRSQSAERIAERGGFSWSELIAFLAGDTSSEAVRAVYLRLGGRV